MMYVYVSGSWRRLLSPKTHFRYQINEPRFVLNSGVHVSFDPDAPSKGQIDVLLLPISILRHHQDLLSGRQIQSQQHSATRQVVLQLPVSRFILLFRFVSLFQKKSVQAFLHVCLSDVQPVCLSVIPSICRSICLFEYLFVSLPIQISNDITSLFFTVNFSLTLDDLL